MVGIEEALNDVETAQILEIMTGRKKKLLDINLQVILLLDYCNIVILQK